MKDVTQTNMIKMATSAYPTFIIDSPSGIEVHVFGEIDGSAYLYRPGWGTNMISGKVDWHHYGDFFQTNCDLEYIPQNVRSGKLKIRYTFN